MKQYIILQYLSLFAVLYFYTLLSFSKFSLI